MSAHADLCTQAMRWLRRSRIIPAHRADRPDALPISAMACGCAVAGTEIGLNREQPDAFGIDTNGTTQLVECKTSRSDFLADAHKWHRKLDREGMRAGLGDYRWYFAPRGVIKPSDDLFGWGHVEVAGRVCTIVRWSKRFDASHSGAAEAMVRLLRIATAGCEKVCGRCQVSIAPWPVEVHDAAPVQVSP